MLLLGYFQHSRYPCSGTHICVSHLQYPLAIPHHVRPASSAPARFRRNISSSSPSCPFAFLPSCTLSAFRPVSCFHSAPRTIRPFGFARPPHRGPSYTFTAACCIFSARSDTVPRLLAPWVAFSSARVYAGSLPCMVARQGVGLRSCLSVPSLAESVCF